MSTLLLLGVALAGVPTKKKMPEEEGEDLYRAHCQGCHGLQALGDGPASAVLRTEAPPLAGRVEALPQSPALTVVFEGRGDMPGYSSMLGIEEARHILLWLSRLDPDTGLHPKKKPPKLQVPVKREARSGDEAPGVGEAPAAEPAEPAEPKPAEPPI